MRMNIISMCLMQLSENSLYSRSLSDRSQVSWTSLMRLRIVATAIYLLWALHCFWIGHALSQASLTHTGKGGCWAAPRSFATWPTPHLLVPMASSSSIKMMEGAFSLARAKASRTSLAPSPMNICTSCGPASFRNVAWELKKNPMPCVSTGSVPSTTENP